MTNSVLNEKRGGIYGQTCSVLGGIENFVPLDLGSFFHQQPWSSPLSKKHWIPESTEELRAVSKEIEIIRNDRHLRRLRSQFQVGIRGKADSL
jgi:hypothetical protein